MSKSGIKVIVLLVIAIVLVLWLWPASHSSKKPQAMKQPQESQEELLARRKQQQNQQKQANKKPAPQKANAQKQAAAKQQPAKPAPAAPQQQAPTQVMVATAELSDSDFELLADRFGRDDPFSPFYSIPVVSDEVMIDLPDIEPLPPIYYDNPSSMKLSAIAVGQDGNGTAVINGDIYREGDFVMGFRVHSISPDRVELINDLNDKAVLRIKQQQITGFRMDGNEISNIADEAEDDLDYYNPFPGEPLPGMNVIENGSYRPLSPLAPGRRPGGPPVGVPVPSPGATPQSSTGSNNAGASQPDVVNDVNNILARPENTPQ